MMMVGEISPGDLLNARDNHNMFAKARLAPGVTIVQAEAAVAAVAAELSQSRPPGWDAAGTFELMATQDVLLSPGSLDDGIRSIAWVLMAVVGCILLVVCVNLTGFLLARALDRRRETAVRAALGATRGALIRPLLTEAALLSLSGGFIGYWLAVWLLVVGPGIDMGVGLTLNPDLSPDLNVMLFTLGVCALAAVVLAVVPALQATRPDVAGTIKSESAAGGLAPRQRWRNALVVTQLTVSMVILVGAGLFLRSLQYQADFDPGFGAQPAGTLAMELPGERYTSEEGAVFVNELVERFGALPGVDAVGVTNGLPLSMGVQWIDFLVDGHLPTGERDTFQADYAIADPGYFAAASIPITRGRAFTQADRDEGERVIIVNEEMAERFWPGEDPLDKILRVSGGSPALPGEVGDMRVVGVSANLAWEALNEEPRMTVFVPYAQFHTPFLTVVARTQGDAAQTAMAMRTAAMQLDPLISIRETSTVAAHLEAQLRPATILAGLLSAFAFVVLVLAAIGLHGVVSYAVATRTREVGIRMALGADAQRIRRLIAVNGLRLVFIGIGVGLALALPFNLMLSRILQGVAAADFVSFAAACLVMCLTAVIAAWLPARRAGRLDPVAALRSD